MTVTQIFIGQSLIFRSEKEGYFIFAGNVDNLFRHFPGRNHRTAGKAETRRGADDIAESGKGLAEIVAIDDPVDHVCGKMGGHLPDLFLSIFPVAHHNQFFDTHVFGAARRRTDVAGILRPVQNYGDMVHCGL
ncbi:MAG: hypothetical protein A4E66_00239 [Syntrophus sp. PtaB.Bin001]|nr:MAG: hypothetical protein A4E66_00239 [Syntrophus sp. PtaB.Bin001]